MKQEYTISEAKAQDAEAIAHFQVDMAKESEGAILDFDTVLKGVAQGIADPTKATYIIARDAQGGPVGSLMLTREWSDWHCAWYWWIQSVYIHPEHRRRGIYRAMYQRVKEMAIESKVSSIRLYADKTNLRAQQTYQSLGMTASHYMIFEEEIM